VSNLDAALIWLNSGVCSQNPAHSFWLEGRPLPLCARELGRFGGFLIASWFARRSSLTWLLGLLPLAVDGLNSFAFDALGMALYEPNNVLRLVTGLLAGVCLAVLLGRMRCWPWLVLLGCAEPWLAVGLLGTVGVLALLASANQLTYPLSSRTAWLVALPELAALALVKQSALALVS
jgi:uncharacterized membrane protein